MGVVSSLPLSLLSSTSKPVLGTKNGQSGERRRYNIHTHNTLSPFFAMVQNLQRFQSVRTGGVNE